MPAPTAAEIAAKAAAIAEAERAVRAALRLLHHARTAPELRQANADLRAARWAVERARSMRG